MHVPGPRGEIGDPRRAPTGAGRSAGLNGRGIPSPAGNLAGPLAGLRARLAGAEAPDGGTQTVKDSPQPQVDFTLGFWIWKPAFVSPSE